MEKEKQKKDISVLVTAGATREPIDAVRHISNFATGRLGTEIAKEAYYRGYDIHLLYGFGIAEVPDYIDTTNFTTTQSLLEKVLEKIRDTDVYISSAAVSDYAPVPEDKKISSEEDELVIRLHPLPKVLKEAKAASREGSTFVAFKLGYNLSEEELIRQAITSYGDIADIVVSNDLKKIEGFKQESVLLYKGQVVGRTHTKQELARAIFDYLERNLFGITYRGQDKYYGRLRADSPSNRKAIRRILNEDRGKSENLLERVFADKILFDIEYILNNGWADEISEEDFFHGHGSVRSYTPLSGDDELDLKTIISPKHIDFNYHTREKIVPRGEEWNIYSPSDGLPMVINPQLTVRGVIYFHFNFKLDENGLYALPPNIVYPERKKISLQCTMMNQ